MTKRSKGAERAGDPYATAPMGELAEPLLPRWFVVLAVALVPVAVVVLLVAFPFLGSDELPAAEVRPPPGPEGAFSHDVGEVTLGSAEPQPAEAQCSAVSGFAVAGSESDRQRLQTALNALCETGVPADAAAALAALRDAGAVVRFAVFERTEVNSVVELRADPPRVLINARFTGVPQPRWVTPLVVHEAVMFDGDPATAATALAARRAELAVCAALFDRDDFSSGCETASELLALDDPAAALRDAGYE